MIQFFVPGIPKPGGSKRAFFNPKTQRSTVVDACRASKDWRASVALAASQICEKPLDGPLSVSFIFQMQRPRGHYGSGKNAGILRASAPAYPAGRPDVLKLSRSTEDALTGIIWTDDSRIVHEELDKVYHERPGAWIKVSEINGNER